MKLHPYLTPLTKINTKWIEGSSIRPDTIKLLEENVGKKLIDTGLGNDFLDITPRVQTAKAKISKLDYIKLKSFCIAKEIINSMEQQPTSREKKVHKPCIR